MTHKRERSGEIIMSTTDYQKQIIFLLCMLFYLLFMLPAYAEQKPIGIVNGSHVNLRKNADIHSPVVGQIEKKGTQVEILTQKDKWYFVQYLNKKAWVFIDLITVVPVEEETISESIDQLIEEIDNSATGRAHFDLGVFAFEEGDYQQAIQKFEQAIQLTSDNPDYYHYMGKSYLETKAYELSKQYLMHAYKMEPTLPDINKDLAMVHYRQSNFSKALENFLPIIKKNPSDIISTYYAAICLYKQNDYYQAQTYFLQAAKKSPTLKINCLYYAAICNIKSGFPHKGRQLLTQVLNNPKAGLLKTYAQKWIAALDRKSEKKKPYHLFAKLGYQYDSNIRLEPLDEDLYTDEDDFCVNIFLSGNYAITDSKPYQISTRMSYFHYLYNEYNQFNTSGTIVNLDTQLRLNPLTIRLGVSPSIFWLDSKPYLKRFTVNPSISYHLNSQWTGILLLSNQFDDNIDNDARDGYRSDNNLTLQYKSPQKKWFVFSTIGIEIMNADDNRHDYDRIISEAGVSISKLWGLTIGLKGKYNQKKYKKTNWLYNALREDFKSTATFYISRSLSQWLGVETKFKFTKNSSNINMFNYERSSLTFMLFANH